MAENKMVEKDYRSVVQRTADAYIPLVEKALSGDGVPTDSYQHQCMANALIAMNDVATANGGESLTAFDKTEVMAALQQVATLRLNVFAQPRECYFVSRKKKMPDGSWGLSIELGIEGDGFDGMLQNFGRNVDTVYPYWAVREGDEFEYPVHRGLEITPPVWTPKGSGKYLRVVYPVKFKDGTVQYFIGERSDVRVNLVAHITNNMMNETFGFAENRYKATVDQKKQIEARKDELKALMNGKDVDVILDIAELQPYISPAWREGAREKMILRKMRNNVVKAVPKDFASGVALASYNNSMAAENGDQIEADFREVDMTSTPSRPVSLIPPIPAEAPAETPVPESKQPAAPAAAPF